MAARVISFHYHLTNTAGEALDSSESRGPLTFMEGSGQIIPGLEKELVKLKKGDKKEIKVPAAEAYGEKEADLLVKVPKASLPAQQIKIGDRFRGGPEEHSPVFSVIEITDTEVTLDANHPLAGQDLIFKIELADIREASEQELSHGHAHGEHGHDH